MNIILLPSAKGDCLLIESGKTSILVDGGMPDSYAEAVRPFLGRWAAGASNGKRRKLDLVYVSHVDQDHIGGILRLLEDLVLWRVHNHKLQQNQHSTAPKFPEPPDVARIWHNSFKAMVPENSGEIASMLASRANSLAKLEVPQAHKLSAAYRNIANSIPEAIKVSRRISSDQLNIPLNGDFDGKLAMVRGKQAIKLNSNSDVSIRILGPFEKDLEVLRSYWNAWLKDAKNAKSMKSLMDWLTRNDRALPGTFSLSIDDELGHRDKVTEPNLASLMLWLEERRNDGSAARVILTGDGHHEEVISGLKHHGLLSDSSGLHVDVLKLLHHGSEHNLDRNFVKLITADHYIICANGEHENPDLRVLEVLLQSRLGKGDQLSGNPETQRPFSIWLNCSSKYLDKQIEAKKDTGNKATKRLEAARDHLLKVEKMFASAKAASNGKFKFHTLTSKPLSLPI